MVLLQVCAIAAIVYVLHHHAGVQSIQRLGTAYAVLLAIAVTANEIALETPGWGLDDLSTHGAWLLASALLGVFLFIADFTVHSMLTAKTVVVDVRYLLVGRAPLGAFIAASMIAILEEILFRAHLSVDLGTGPWFFVATGVTFGLMHVSFGAYAVASKTVLGLVLGAVYVASGSVACAIVSHIVYNWFVMVDRNGEESFT